jgi:hypothetical protein
MEHVNTRSGVFINKIHEAECSIGWSEELTGDSHRNSLSASSWIPSDLANGVVATSEVVGSILLAGDQLLRVEQLAVGASADLIHDSGLQVQEDGTWDVLASTSLREEGVEGIVTTTNGLVRGHLAIRLNAVLQAVELPAGIADLKRVTA